MSNDVLKSMFNGPAPSAGAGLPVADPFAGLGSATESQRSEPLPVGRHECRITKCLANSGAKGVFYIVECELLRTDVESLPLGKGYSIMKSMGRPIFFQPWLKGLIRAALALGTSEEVELQLQQNAEQIARRSITEEQILKDRVFGVRRKMVPNKDNPQFTHWEDLWFSVVKAG